MTTRIVTNENGNVTQGQHGYFWEDAESIALSIGGPGGAEMAVNDDAVALPALVALCAIKDAQHEHAVSAPGASQADRVRLSKEAWAIAARDSWIAGLIDAEPATRRYVLGHIYRTAYRTTWGILGYPPGGPYPPMPRSQGRSEAK